MALHERFTPCSQVSEAMDSDQIADQLALLNDWELIHHHGIARLQKHFRFNDFAQALAFTNRVGTLAEQYNHHPELTTSWGEVRIRWWTQKIRGLHLNDFILADKTDRL